MSDLGADVLAEWRAVPENVVSLSVFAFGCRSGIVVEGVLISAFVKYFLVRGAALSNEALSDERVTSRKVMIFLFASMVRRSSLLLRILQIFFVMFSVSLGVVLVVVSPSSL